MDKAKPRDNPLYFAVALLHIFIPVIALLPLLIAATDALLSTVWQKLQDRQYEPLLNSSANDAVLPTPRVEDNGITSVVISRRVYRTTLMLCLYPLIALTYFLDGTIFTLHAVIGGIWESGEPADRLSEFYIIGTFVAFAGCSIGMIWQQSIRRAVGSWDKWFPVSIAGSTWAGEIALLGVSSAILQKGWTSTF